MAEPSAPPRKYDVMNTVFNRPAASVESA
jgi:hypothetical protein